MLDLSEGDKTKLLMNNKLPAVKPVGVKGERVFNPNIVKHTGEIAKHIQYSVENDKLYCLCCSMFSQKGPYLPTKFMEQGYDNWKNLSDKKSKKGLAYHLSSQHHTLAHLQAENLIKYQKDSINEIGRQFGKEKLKQLERNKKLLEVAIDSVRVCGAQGIALRGHDEKYESEKEHKNRGNFIALTELAAKYDPQLEKVINEIKEKKVSGKKTSATMLSNRIQNEIIDIFSKEILDQIVSDVKNAGFYVIIADECSVFNNQFLSLCIRYHDETRGIQEEFVSYIEMEQADAKSILEYLLKELKVAGLDLGKTCE